MKAKPAGPFRINGAETIQLWRGTWWKVSEIAGQAGLRKGLGSLPPSGHGVELWVPTERLCPA